MAYEIDLFLKQEAARCQPKLPVGLVLDGKMGFVQWQEALREGVQDKIGAFPSEPPELDLTKIREEKLEGVTRQFLTFQSQEGLTVPAYYLIPDQPLPGNPAVVAVTGHGFGVDDIVGIDEYGNNYPDEKSAGYQKQFALTLARKGFYVIAPEPLGFGHLRLAEDKQKDPRATSCHRVSTSLLMCGTTVTSVRVYECVRCLDVLAELGDADLSRVGCMGISGGGLVATFFAALEPRIRACVISGYANYFRTSVMAMHHCVDNFFHGMLNLCELPDILSLVAPRPMLWEMGTEDPIFPVEAGREAASAVQGVYGLLDVPERFQVDIFQGDHQISGAKSYDFLTRHLTND